MNSNRLARVFKIFVPGAFVLQIGGCLTDLSFNEIAQTFFLGVTALGSLAILENL